MLRAVWPRCVPACACMLASPVPGWLSGILGRTVSPQPGQSPLAPLMGGSGTDSTERREKLGRWGRWGHRAGVRVTLPSCTGRSESCRARQRLNNGRSCVSPSVSRAQARQQGGRAWVLYTRVWVWLSDHSPSHIPCSERGALAPHFPAPLGPPPAWPSQGLMCGLLPLEPQGLPVPAFVPAPRACPRVCPRNSDLW